MEIEEKKEKKSLRKSLLYKSKLFLKQMILAGDFFRSQIALWMLAVNLFANIVDWIILAVFVNKIDAGIILHYNVYFGVDAVGSWKDVFIFPAIGLVLFVLNTALAIYFYKQRERIASYILLMAAFMAQLSLIIASVSVIIINY